MSSAQAPMHVVAHGDGVPVLALHGWTPDHRLMTGCLEPVFARRVGYRRLYPDLPGMGRTPAAPSTNCSDDLLAAVLDLVDREVGAAPFLVVGESYGGYLARAVVRDRADQVLGMALICPIGTKVRNEDRNVPPPTATYADPDLLAELPPDLPFRHEFSVQTRETLRRARAEIDPGIRIADEGALARIRRRWVLQRDPEDGPPFERPSLILTGRQDASTGYVDQFPLLEHYPRATYAVLDRSGHNLQIEQPHLFDALMHEWLDRVEEHASARRQ